MASQLCIPLHTGCGLCLLERTTLGRNALNWLNKKVLVTGGASFIGSHLTDALVGRGAKVRVADNLSSGLRENLHQHLARQTIDFHVVDLLDPGVAQRMTEGMELVFHLAADHGGRGYIDTHQVNCSTNLILDGTVFRAASKSGVEKVVFASSGCVYPNSLQTNPAEPVFLTEDLVRPPYDADKLYGWAKLMGELVLKAYCSETGMKGASVRYFTAYGPRCPESHAVVAMIARAFVEQNPFEVWGTGEQIRNWTHVDDIVEGTLRAAERIDDGTAVNIGTMERTSVMECTREILSHTKKNLRIVCDPTKPTGPYNRVCDTTLCERLLGWVPRVKFREGLHATIEWYFSTHSREAVLKVLPHLLTERKHA